MIGLLLSGPPTAIAEDSLRSALHACAALVRDAERLACFDGVAERAATDKSTGSPPTAEDVFGVGERRATRSGREGASAREELQQITAKVIGLRHERDGAVVIELDNGQSWRQIDGSRRLVLRVGDTVTISRAALGSFRLATSENRFARVSRVR